MGPRGRGCGALGGANGGRANGSCASWWWARLTDLGAWLGGCGRGLETGAGPRGGANGGRANEEGEPVVAELAVGGVNWFRGVARLRWAWPGGWGGAFGAGLWGCGRG